MTKCTYTCSLCDAVGMSDHMLPMSQHCDMVFGTCMFTNKQVLASLHGGIGMLAHKHAITKHHQWHYMYAMSLCHQVLHWAYLFPHMPCHSIAFHHGLICLHKFLSQCNHMAVNVHACLHTSSVLALPFGSIDKYVLM